MFLVADFAINFKDPLDVRTDVSDDRTGEGVLGIGIDIHFDDAVA